MSGTTPQETIPVVEISDLNDGIWFDIVNRTIIPKSNISDVLIQNDSNSRNFGFMIQRYFENVDLSTKSIRVHYVNASNQHNIGATTSISITGKYEDVVSFRWLVSNRACYEAGNLKFAVEFYDGLGYSLFTKPINISIGEGIVTVGEIPENETWYNDLINRVEALETYVLEGEDVRLWELDSGVYQIKPNSVFHYYDAELAGEDSGGTYNVVYGGELMVNVSTTSVRPTPSIVNTTYYRNFTLRTMATKPYTMPPTNTPIKLNDNAVIVVIQGCLDSHNTLTNFKTSYYDDIPNRVEALEDGLVTEISSESSDTQYPSAKSVYDAIENIPTGLPVFNNPNVWELESGVYQVTGRIYVDDSYFVNVGLCGLLVLRITFGDQEGYQRYNYFLMSHNLDMYWQGFVIKDAEGGLVEAVHIPLTIGRSNESIAAYPNSDTTIPTYKAVADYVTSYVQTAIQEALANNG